MRKDYIDNIKDAERRFYVCPVQIEKRTDESENGSEIGGYAALFNTRTDLGWFEEEVLPGAFDSVLKDDTRCLFNHNPNYILARSTNGKGTLKLSVDEKGLKYEYITPNRSYAKDLEDAIDKGDVTQSSFAFIAEEVRWIEKEGEKDLRQIVKVGELFDVAPVTYPAYTDTSVAKRSHEAYKEDVDEEDGAKVDESRNNELDEHEAQFMYNKNKVLK